MYGMLFERVNHVPVERVKLTVNGNNKQTYNEKSINMIGGEVRRLNMGYFLFVKKNQRI
jgi:hypothetical protein